MFDSPLKDGLIVLIIVLLFFGPKRLPALSRAIGESVREFRGGIGGSKDKKSAIRPAEPVQTPTPAAPEPVAAEARSPEPAATGSERTDT